MMGKSDIGVMVKCLLTMMETLILQKINFICMNMVIICRVKAMGGAIWLKSEYLVLFSVQDKSYVTIGNKTYPSHDLEDYEMNASKRAEEIF